MDAMVDRCAALDVHMDTVMACVRVPDGKGGRAQHVREFRTFTAGLRALRDWLAEYAATQVAMEATGVYWKPVWHVLEAETGWELLLTNAQACEEPAGSQDRRRRCCLAGSVAGVRAAAGQLQPTTGATTVPA